MCNVYQSLPAKQKWKRASESASLLSNGPEDPVSYCLLEGLSQSNVAQSEATPSASMLLRDFKLRSTLISMAFLAFTDMAYEVLIPLIYSTSIDAGGLGLSSRQIGLILGIFMLLNGVWNWVVMTPILKIWGPRKTVIVSYSFFLIHFTLLFVLRSVAAQAGRITSVVWAILVLQLFVSTVIVTAFSKWKLLIASNSS